MEKLTPQLPVPPLPTTVTVTAAADGLLDVVSASQSDSTVAWHKNGGGPVPSWTAYTISTTITGACGVFAIDLDGDEHVDVLAGSESDYMVTWFKNGGESPPSWTPYTIATVGSGTCGVFASDVDGDGLVDAMSACCGENKVAWYRNEGGSPPTWTINTITTGAMCAASLFSIDIDGECFGVEAALEGKA
jgi:hypothetical protein